MGAASAWVRSAPRIMRHLAFVIPAAAERRSPPDAAGRGAFGHIIGEPTTDHAARYYKFESANHRFRDDFTGSTSRYPRISSPTSFSPVTARRHRPRIWKTAWKSNPALGVISIE